MTNNETSPKAARWGVKILSAWCLVNLLPGVGSLVFIALGHHAPALRYLLPDDALRTLDGRALAAIDGVATLANTLIVVHCGLMFFVVGRCLAKRERWAFFVLVAGLSLIQFAGYVVDRVYFLNQNLVALNVSTLILVVGFGLCARGLFAKPTMGPA